MPAFVRSLSKPPPRDADEALKLPLTAIEEALSAALLRSFASARSTATPKHRPRWSLDFRDKKDRGRR